MKSILFTTLLLSACGPAPRLVQIEFGWAVYADSSHTFALQQQFRAIASANDGEAQCEADQYRLPTMAEWYAVQSLDFKGITAPHYAEWALDGRFVTEGADARYTVFRCAQTR
jgi:hypothetical protein